jgi:hypothetical protein
MRAGILAPQVVEAAQRWRSHHVAPSDDLPTTSLGREVVNKILHVPPTRTKLKNARAPILSPASLSPLPRNTETSGCTLFPPTSPRNGGRVLRQVVSPCGRPQIVHARHAPNALRRMHIVLSPLVRVRCVAAGKGFQGAATQGVHRRHPPRAAWAHLVALRWRSAEKGVGKSRPAVSSRRCHICAGTGLSAATSAPGLGPLLAGLRGHKVGGYGGAGGGGARTVR